jgi:crotonobetainyl-CoA:carnitine CoA-transferase CaiB-like acyl-CoA transferase
LPLAGVRVLTFEAFGAGPFGSMYLADLGAEVIKIENRAQGGDAPTFSASTTRTSSRPSTTTSVASASI